jgi:hypothetical protein
MRHKPFGNTPPSKETLLKMAQIHQHSFLGRNDRQMWYCLLAWANYKFWLKYEWPNDDK